MKNVLIAGYVHECPNYAAAMEAAGVTYAIETENVDVSQFERLLLPGGDDIQPSIFGQENHGSRKIDEALDRRQLAIMDAFVKAGKPVLGICKGSQIINVYFGGDIIQDLPTNTAHQHNVTDQTHTAVCVPGSVLEQLYGRFCTINSSHHQGNGKIGKGLHVTMMAGDGVVEGIEHESLPIIAVQWHPERIGYLKWREPYADGAKIINYFLSL